MKAGSVTNLGISASDVSWLDDEDGLVCRDDVDLLAACRSRREKGRVLYPSHLRPVVTHLLHSGLASSHFTRLMLRYDSSADKDSVVLYRGCSRTGTSHIHS